MRRRGEVTDGRLLAQLQNQTATPILSDVTVDGDLSTGSLDIDDSDRSGVREDVSLSPADANDRVRLKSSVSALSLALSAFAGSTMHDGRGSRRWRP